MTMIDWESPVLKALIQAKADMLNMAQTRKRSQFVKWLRGEKEDDVEGMLGRIHVNLNNAIDAFTGSKNNLFCGPSIMLVSAEEIKKQLMEKHHGG